MGKYLNSGLNVNIPMPALTADSKELSDPYQQTGRGQTLFWTGSAFVLKANGIF